MRDTPLQISASRYEKHPPRPFDVERLRGLTPVRMLYGAGGRRVHWVDFGQQPFSDPFFFQTVERYLERDRTTILETGCEALEALRRRSPGLVPNGFIYHVSFCGSTALSNVLRAIRHNVTISEPAPLNAAFYDASATEAERVEWLRGLVSAFGQRRSGTERSLVIKLSSWALLYFPLLQKAFPETPWICLVRHPVEVLAGQLMGESVRTYWLDREFVNLEREARIDMGLAEAAARTMGRYYELILEMRKLSPHGLCVDHSQLSEETYLRVAEHFRITTDAADHERMREAAGRYSKDPKKAARFESDSKAKRSRAYPVIHETARRWALEPYSKLGDLG